MISEAENVMSRAIEPNRHIAEMKMKYSDLNENNVILILEGSDDVKFFKKFINKDGVEIPSLREMNGKTNLIKVIEIIYNNVVEDPKIQKFRKNSQILGIVDCDFEKIEGEKEFNGQNYDHEHILTTDTHDIETMILHENSKTLERFLEKYADPEELNAYLLEVNKPDVRTYLCDLGYLVGLMRYFREKNIRENNIREKNYGRGKFKDYFSYTFYLEQYTNCDKKKLIEYCFAGFDDTDIQEILTHYEEGWKRDLIWHICHGHDLMAFLEIILERRSILSEDGRTEWNKPPRKLNQDIGKIAEETFRDQYGYSDFLKTDIFNSIIAWEKKNHKSVLEKPT